LGFVKADLIYGISTKKNLTKRKAEALIDTILDAMFEALLHEERIEIRGFASWYVKHYKAYTGRNPKTGAPVNVKEKKLPYFKCGKELKMMLNPDTG